RAKRRCCQVLFTLPSAVNRRFAHPRSCRDGVQRHAAVTVLGQKLQRSVEGAAFRFGIARTPRSPRCILFEVRHSNTIRDRIEIAKEQKWKSESLEAEMSARRWGCAGPARGMT